MVAPEPTTALSLSITGILASAPMGVSVESMALGMVFAIVGMLGRFAFEVQKSLEGGDKIRLLQTLGWTGAGLIGAPFLSIAWIVLLRGMGAQTDVSTVIGLLFLGFTGPKGVTWLFGMIVDFIGQRILKGQPAPPKPELKT